MHIPVMLKEVLEGLQLKSGDRIVDATLGLGGHTEEILKRTAPDGVVIGFDRDARNIALAKEHLQAYEGRVQFIHASFAEADQIEGTIQGALYDLGFSSLHVDEAERGFSFQQEGPLDMRYDQSSPVTAEDIVNGWSKEELAALFRKYGEEPFSAQIAKAIFDARKQKRITTTTGLAEVVESVVRRKGKAHPATRVFQALRIEVNDEFGEFERSLPKMVDKLEVGGRLAIISFHSMEDRIVKHAIRNDERLKRAGKPLRPTYEERVKNPRARSAKLRIIEKISA